MTGRIKQWKAWVMTACITFLLVMSSIPVAAASNPSVSLETTSTSLQKGVSATISLVLENATKASDVQIQGIDDFDVLSTNQSSSTQIVNGSVSQQVQYNYIVMPKTTGDFDLTATVTIGNQSYTSNTLHLSVSETSSTTATQADGDIFLKTILSEDSIYFGEKVLLTYDLYSRYNVQQFGATDSISMDNFVLDDISSDNPQGSVVDIDGIQYVKYEVKQYVLTPTDTGELTIPSENFQVVVGSSGFFSQTQSTYVQSDEEDITVKSLPTEGQPADFNGLIGDFTLTSSYDSDTVEYGSSLTLSIDISGQGNLDTLGSILGSDDIDGFSVYETAEDADIDYSNESYNVDKSYEDILVPKETGDIKVDAITIPYFNTKTETYDTLEVPETLIHVDGTASSNDESTSTNSGGGSNASTSDNGVSSQEIAASPIVINQINTGRTSSDGTITISIPQVLLWALIGLVIVILLLVLFLVRYKKMSSKDIGIRQLKKSLKNVNNLSDSYQIYSQLLDQRYQIQIRSQSKEAIYDQMEDKEKAKIITEIVDYMEYHRFYNEMPLASLKDKMLSTL